MATYNKFNSFVEKLAEKVFNLGSDQLKIALCAAANTPTATMNVLTDLTEIAYTNLSTRNITTTSSAQTSGLYKLILANLTLTASGGAVAAFRYIVIYDDTATNKDLIGWADYGSANTMADGDQFIINFDQTNGAINIQ